MTKCKVCKFWDNQDEDKGLCRILPPTYNSAFREHYLEIGKAIWPLSLETDSCGAGKPK